jgi:hypothetical protein
MKSKGNMTIAGAFLASLLLLVVCDTASAFRLLFWRRPARKSPPAHAPAHGYRRQHIHGYELVFDTGLGVYVAVGHTDVYYHQGHFYRFHGGVWQISLRADVWQPAGIDKLPPGLQVKAKSMAKLNGNGNSLVKLNGNGNSLVKLNGSANNGNPRGNANPLHAHSGVKASRLSDGPGGNANSSGKPDATANKPGAGSADKDNKAAKANTNGNNNKLSGNSPTKPDAHANANQRSNKPAGRGKAKSGSKGRGKRK